MQREREQVQRGMRVGETVAPLPEIAVDAVTVAHQAVEPLALDRPAGSPSPHDRRQVAGPHGEAGEERVETC